MFEEYSDCTQYFRVARSKMKKRNRVATIFNLLTTVPAQHQQENGQARDLSTGPAIARNFQSIFHLAQVSHLGWLIALLLLALLCTNGEVARMQPNPLPQAGHTSPLVVLRVRGHKLHAAWLITAVNPTLPNGTASAVITDDMEKDQEWGVIWGNHPQTSSSQRAAFRKAVLDKKETVFACTLGTYKGARGSFVIPLLHHFPIMAKRRRKLPLETQIQEEKCQSKKVGSSIQPPQAVGMPVYMSRRLKKMLTLITQIGGYMWTSERLTLPQKRTNMVASSQTSSQRYLRA